MTPNLDKLKVFTSGVRLKKIFDDKIQTALLSVITTGIIGCFTFLWNLNSTVARLQENMIDTIRAKEEQSVRINNIQLDIRDIRERLIRIETKQRKP